MVRSKKKWTRPASRRSKTYCVATVASTGWIAFFANERPETYLVQYLRPKVKEISSDETIDAFVVHGESHAQPDHAVVW